MYSETKHEVIKQYYSFLEMKWDPETRVMHTKDTKVQGIDGPMTRHVVMDKKNERSATKLNHGNTR